MIHRSPNHTTLTKQRTSRRAIHHLHGVRLVAVQPLGRGGFQRGTDTHICGGKCGLGGDEAGPHGRAGAVGGVWPGEREPQLQDPQPTGLGWLDEVLRAHSGEQFVHNVGAEEAGVGVRRNFGQEGVEDDIHGRREGHPAAEELGEKPNIPDAGPPVRRTPEGAAARVDHQDAQIAFDALEIGDEGDLQPQEDEEVGVQKKMERGP